MYSGGTTINAGTLQIGNGGASGSISGNILNNASLVFDRSDVYTYSDAISGTGSVSQIGSGTLILTATNPYSGGTTVSNGILQIGSESNIGGGSAGGITLNGGEILTSATAALAENITLNTGTANTLAAFTNTTVTYNGLIADGNGHGALTIGDSLGNNGTVILNGNNTYTGGTIVSGGILQISSENNIGGNNAGGITLNGGEVLASSFYVENITLNTGVTNTLAAFTDSGVTYFGLIADGNGPGGLTIGDGLGNNGTVFLSRVNTYSGPTTINATLAISGSIADSSGVTLAAAGESKHQ
jgi:autotransporter-associated beta strand protein